MPPLPYILFDTGPLLSFGACKGGTQLLRDRYEDRAGCVADIMTELAGLSRSNIAALAKAAATAARFTWIDQIEVTDEARLMRAEELRSQLRAFQKRPDQNQNPRHDWGECVTLAYAEEQQQSGIVVVVANEDAKRPQPSAGLCQQRSAPRPGPVQLLDVLERFVESARSTRSLSASQPHSRQLLPRPPEVSPRVAEPGAAAARTRHRTKRRGTRW